MNVLADDILKYFFYFLGKKYGLTFHVNHQPNIQFTSNVKPYYLPHCVLRFFRITGKTCGKLCIYLKRLANTYLSWPWWLSWMRRLTGVQEDAGSTLAEVGNILLWRLIFYSHSLPSADLAKECAQYWLNT